MTSRYQLSSSNQFERSVIRGVVSERQQFRIQSPVETRWKHAESIRISHPALENHLKIPPHSRPMRAEYNYPPFKPNQLRSRSSLQVPISHHQFKRRSVESVKLSCSASLHRYKPYLYVAVLGPLRNDGK